MNSSVATNTAGMLLVSNQTASCTLHVVQLPQSATASITKLHSFIICCLRSCGAGFDTVGFIYRLTVTSGICSFINCSRRSINLSPRGFDISRSPIVPDICSGRFARLRYIGSRSSVGSIMTTGFDASTIFNYLSQMSYFSIFLLVTVESSPIRLENPSNIAENLPAWLPATTI